MAYNVKKVFCIATLFVIIKRLAAKDLVKSDQWNAPAEQMLLF